MREARKAFKPPLTQDRLSGQLASKGVQIDRVALAKIEGGTRRVFDFELKALADVLKRDVNWLLGVSVTQPPSGIASRAKRSK